MRSLGKRRALQAGWGQLHLSTIRRHRSVGGHRLIRLYLAAVLMLVAGLAFAQDERPTGYTRSAN
jgi:hypothetical protein